MSNIYASADDMNPLSPLCKAYELYNLSIMTI